MTPEMQAKIKAALEKRAAAAEDAAKAAEASAASERLPEEAHVQSRAVVEEFMSITDGQVMVESFSPETGWGISVKDSVSRIGSPGAAGPLMSLDMLQLRLDVMQADDMTVFGREGTRRARCGTDLPPFGDSSGRHRATRRRSRNKPSGCTRCRRDTSAG